MRQQGLVPCARADMAVHELGACDALSQLQLLRGAAGITEVGVAAGTFQVDERDANSGSTGMGFRDSGVTCSGGALHLLGTLAQLKI